MVEDADRYHSLKNIFDQPDGQILVDTLIEDSVGAVNLLESNYQAMSRDELVNVIARLSASLNLARALSRASENLADVDQALDEALRG